MAEHKEGRREDVIRILMESDVPLQSCTIAERLHTTSRIICTTLGHVKRMKVPHYGQRMIDGTMWYAIGKGKLPPEVKVKKEVFKIALPDDIGRGWHNPLTGVTGVKLGV